MPPIATTLFAAPLMMLVACSGGDGDAGVAAQGGGSSRSYPIDGFRAVELSGSDDVEVRVGPAFSVRAEGPAKVLDRLKIERDGESLDIGRRRGVSGSGKARVLVTLPRLTGASVAGSGTMTVDRVVGGDLSVEIAGSGSLRLAMVQVDGLDVDIAGSGTLHAAGTARKVDFDLAGSGGIDAPGLVAQGAEISIAGSSDVRTVVKGAAKVEILGSGDVDLGPAARCTVQKMGSGNVRCG